MKKILLPWEEISKNLVVRYSYPKPIFSLYECTVFLNGINWKYSMVDPYSNYIIRGNAETKELAQSLVDKILVENKYTLLDERLLVLL